jgi:hypothetical protein
LQHLAPSTSTSPRRTPLAVDAVFVQPSRVTSASVELHSRPPRSQSHVDLVQLPRSAPYPRALPASPPQSFDSRVTSASAALHSRPPRSQSHVDLVQLARSAPSFRALPASPPQSSDSIVSQAAVSTRSLHFSGRASAGRHVSPKPK